MGFLSGLGAAAGVLNPVAALGTGLSMLGGFADFQGAKETANSARDVAAQQVNSTREQMAFQERMSNSAFQRGTADMRKAGINPMMAADQGGASSPPGANVGGLPVPESPLSGIQTSALESFRMFNERKMIDAKSRETNASADLTELERNYARKNPDAYFMARQGAMNTLGAKAFEAIGSSAKSIRSNWRSQSFPNVLELFSGPGYISHDEMKRRSSENLMKKRGRVSK